MAGDIVTFPIRVGLRAASLALRAGVHASERAISIASFLVKSATSSGVHEHGTPSEPGSDAHDEHDTRTTRPSSPRVSPGRSSAPSGTQAAPSNGASGESPEISRVREPAAPPPPLPQPEPVHVSEEPTLVEEFAEPGAEDGAGAQVTIGEPWEGYARMNARDIIARVTTANAVELAAMQLYEASHRNRETVVSAIERELRAKSAQGAATADKNRKERNNGG